MDKKVYCKDCKYFNQHLDTMDYASHSCDRVVGIFEDYTYGKLKKYARGFDANRDFKCKYYKRKWWKIWT